MTMPRKSPGLAEYAVAVDIARNAIWGTLLHLKVVSQWADIAEGRELRRTIEDIDAQLKDCAKKIDAALEGRIA
jgi:DNA-directed RNA polymerase